MDDSIRPRRPDAPCEFTEEQALMSDLECHELKVSGRLDAMKLREAVLVEERMNIRMAGVLA